MRHGGDALQALRAGKYPWAGAGVFCFGFRVSASAGVCVGGVLLACLVLLSSAPTHSRLSPQVLAQGQARVPSRFASMPAEASLADDGGAR